jgi:tripeptide aminopeptidase
LGYRCDDNRAAALLFKALDELGIERKPIPMRGGTDGAVLSACAIPTPNFFTGAHNFHSRFEFLSVFAFEKSFEVASMIALATEQEDSASRARDTGVGPPWTG